MFMRKPARTGRHLLAGGITCLGLIALAWALGAPGQSLAVDGPGEARYVRAGAQGNGRGTDWTNAYPQLPESLVRGCTYYVADGRYPGYVFDDPASGDARITIRKATADDHGTSVGWSASLGDGVAVWQPLTISAPYVTLDGATGSGQRGHGFEVYSDEPGTLISFQNAPHDIAIRHCRLHFSSVNLKKGDALYGDTPCQRVTVANCYIHDIPRCPLLMRHWTELLFERNWVARNRCTPEEHSEGVSTHGGGHFVFRNNVWQDIEGTAVIVNLHAPTKDWKIYGNVFVQSAPGAVGGLGHGIVSDNFGESPIDGLEFCHNTIVGQHGGASGLQFWCEGSRNIRAVNNIWLGCENVAFNQVAYDYNMLNACTFPNAYAQAPGPNDVRGGAEDLFVDSRGLDFRLKQPTPPGTPLSAPFDVAPDGKRRGTGGHWDRGAYQFVAAK